MSMKPSVWRRVDLTLRRRAPLALTLLLTLMAVVPAHVPDLERVGPILPVICVYFWAVYRPGAMGCGSVFIVGLFEDLIGGGPLGVSCLSLLLVRGAVGAQMKFFRGKPFVVVWWAFIAIAAMAVSVRWAGVTLLWGVVSDPLAALASYGMTLAAFPAIGWVLSWAQALVLREEASP